jgi:hypothetical protein
MFLIIKNLFVIIILISFFSLQINLVAHAGSAPNTDLSYKAFYSKSVNVIWWVVSACAAVACAVAFIYSGGTATPIVVSIAT